MGIWNTIAGAADHAAGSTDEAFGRQFDNQEGGGIADADTYTGIADHLAGSVDESIGRQFDSDPGGGFADETANTVWSGMSGQADWWMGEYDEAAGDAAESAASAASAASIGGILVPAAAVAVGVAYLGRDK